MQFNNNEIITVTYVGGAFDVDSFLFNAPGTGGDINVAGGGSSTLLTETQNGTAMTSVSVNTEYDGITSFTFQNAGRGSGRVDNMVFTVASVPLPAAGLMLLAGVGALFGRRRRTSA